MQRSQIRCRRWRTYLDAPGRRREDPAPRWAWARTTLLLWNVYVYFDGLAFFESEIELGGGFVAESLLLLEDLEVILEGDVEVEAVGAIRESDPNVRLPSGILNTDYEVPGIIRNVT